VGPRLLRLAGRHDDLINLGGNKVPASQVEARVRELVEVRDCAVQPSVYKDCGPSSTR
jgi:non-ribosomal peptide synthetase component E (peptide arylation enzyme)